MTWTASLSPPTRLLADRGGHGLPAGKASSVVVGVHKVNNSVLELCVTLRGTVAVSFSPFLLLRHRANVLRLDAIGTW